MWCAPMHPSSMSWSAAPRRRRQAELRRAGGRAGGLKEGWVGGLPGLTCGGMLLPAHRRCHVYCAVGYRCKLGAVHSNMQHTCNMCRRSRRHQRLRRGTSRAGPAAATAAAPATAARGQQRRARQRQNQDQEQGERSRKARHGRQAACARRNEAPSAVPAGGAPWLAVHLGCAGGLNTVWA